MIYFAYGSCMSETDLRRTVPDAVLIGTGVLRDRRLDFTTSHPSRGGGIADVVPHEGGIVWGVLWEVPDFDALDVREDHPRTYRRFDVSVEMAGEIISAQTYEVVNRGDRIQPHPDYLALISTSVPQGTPHDYLSEFMLT